MLGPLADQASETDWLASGSYSVPHPVLKQYRVISLNTVYFSPKYRNACATADSGDAAKNEMDWFASKLAEAKAHGEKVWLLFHIAPGIDGYATSHPKGAGEKKIVPMWKPEYTAEFQRLLQQYRDSITISLAGHEHMDDFRLIDHSLVLLAPGLSPLVGQSPAFRVVGYQRSGELTDATTYYLSNLGDFDGGQKPLWQEEYSFEQNWSMPHLDFPSFDKLFRRVEVDSEMRAQWMALYGVSHPEGGAITPKTFPWLFCAAGNVSEINYDACLRRLQPQ
jgi:sphingomyelin phosphodiesterase acid-like 3